MLFNQSMGRLLANLHLEHIHPRKGLSIFQGMTQTGQPYWSIENLGGLHGAHDKDMVRLMDLEWNRNEVYISGSTDIFSMVAQGLEIIAAWKEEMQLNYSHISFDIILSVDPGEKALDPSVTLRFWAVRNQEHHVYPSQTELEKFSQPVLMEQVNYNP